MKQENKEFEELKEKPVEEEVFVAVEDQTETVVEEDKSNEELTDLIRAEDVLTLLDRARTSLARKAGNAINVPVREVRALINGLITDVSALKGEK